MSILIISGTAPNNPVVKGSRTNSPTAEVAKVTTTVFERAVGQATDAEEQGPCVCARCFPQGGSSDIPHDPSRLPFNIFSTMSFRGRSSTI